MSNDEKKTYIVKRPITFMGSVFEAGSEINLTDADAHNIGMGDFINEKKPEGEAVTTPPAGEGEANTPTPPSTEGGETAAVPAAASEGSVSQTDKPAGEGSEGSPAAGSDAGSENSQA